jgi:hypothetical protein
VFQLRNPDVRVPEIPALQRIGQGITQTAQRAVRGARRLINPEAVEAEERAALRTARREVE